MTFSEKSENFLIFCQQIVDYCSFECYNVCQEFIKEFGGGWTHGRKAHGSQSAQNKAAASAGADAAHVGKKREGHFRTRAGRHCRHQTRHFLHSP